MHEYFHSNGENLERIEIGLPISLRQASKSIKDFKLNNDMVGLPVTLELFKGFDEGLKHYKRYMGNLKNSLDPFGVLYLFAISIYLPFVLPRIAINLISNKFALTYSNTNLTKIPLDFDGKKSHGAFYIANTPGLQSCSFTLCTMGEVMKACMFSDKNSMKDPQRMINILEKKYEELITRLKES